jgi:hypothetical protein
MTLFWSNKKISINQEESLSFNMLCGIVKPIIKDVLKCRAGKSVTFVADYCYFFQHKKFCSLTDCNSDMFFPWQISLLVNQKRSQL